jgi:hypothetical protein
MKILVLHQPYPMGNYRLNQIAGHVFSQWADVGFLQQLNMGPNREAEDLLHTIITDFAPDIIYFEMLDQATFNVIELIDCEKVLVCASKGIFPQMEDVLSYYGRYYTKLMTNSQKLFKLAKDKEIPVEDWQYYFTAIADNELEVKDEYKHDIVFLGQGFHRQHSDQYSLERDLFFDIDLKKYDAAIYGNGWNDAKYPHAKGLLPAEDIGRLYTSAMTGFAMIDVFQRGWGMINNRYTEMAYCKLPIITFPYDEIDWFGLEKFMYFAHDESSLKAQVDVIKLASLSGDVKFLQEGAKEFMLEQHQIFFDKFRHLTGLTAKEISDEG